METAIQTDGLTKVYKLGWGGTQVGLSDLTLQVNKGEIFGLVGPNGSGKTTTLKLLLGLIFPTKGKATVLGEPIGSVGYRRHVGFLPEGSYFYDHLNAVEVLGFYGGLFGLGGKALRDRISDLLHLVNMWDYRHTRIGTYSKGMRQRIGLAQALINDPDVVFLDEPTSGLDPRGSFRIRQTILNLKQQGKTIFLCTHLLSHVEQICDRVAILHRGRLVKEGALSDILTVEDARFVEANGVEESALDSVAAMTEEVVCSDGVLHVKIARDADLYQVIEAIRRAGGEIVRVGQRRHSLEELFIDLTGGVSGQDDLEAEGRAGLAPDLSDG